MLDESSSLPISHLARVIKLRRIKLAILHEHVTLRRGSQIVRSPARAIRDSQPQHGVIKHSLEVLRRSGLELLLIVVLLKMSGVAKNE